MSKKVVSRTLAIVLGVVCIVLASGLVGLIINYTSIINGKDNTITTLNSQITSQTNKISSLSSQLSRNITLISQLDSQITDLTSQKNMLQAWLNSNITKVVSLQSQISNLNNTISTLKSQKFGIELMLLNTTGYSVQASSFQRELAQWQSWSWLGYFTTHAYSFTDFWNTLLQVRASGNIFYDTNYETVFFQSFSNQYQLIYFSES
jgi:hypothetical protein